MSACVARVRVRVSYRVRCGYGGTLILNILGYGYGNIYISITANTSEEVVKWSNALTGVAYFLGSNLTHALDFLNF
jgi:hypothetical protein